jgi:hypothetical protein
MAELEFYQKVIVVAVTNGVFHPPQSLRSGMVAKPDLFHLAQKS